MAQERATRAGLRELAPAMTSSVPPAGSPAPRGLDDIANHITVADIEVERLCNGGRWTMCIPARPDVDSDLLIARALGDARYLLGLVSQQDAEIAALREDKARLDALERYAIAYNTRGGSEEDFARLMMDEEETEVEFSVTGLRTSWGCRIGQGATLRAAIDGARQWEDAPNLEDFADNVPARSSPPGGTNL